MIDPKEMSSKDLAKMVKFINSTSATPSTYEQACLSEAADRLDQMDEILDNFIDYTMNEIKILFILKKWAKDKIGELVCDYTPEEILDIMNTCKENILRCNNVS